MRNLSLVYRVFEKQYASDGNGHIVKSSSKAPFVSTETRYKYLDYLPKPKSLPSNLVDFVDDLDFQWEDGRIPMFMVTQFGIFPAPDVYPDKSKRNYRCLEGFEGKSIALFGKAYLSGSECNGIIHCEVNRELYSELQVMPAAINLSWWTMWNNL